MDFVHSDAGDIIQTNCNGPPTVKLSQSLALCTARRYTAAFWIANYGIPNPCGGSTPSPQPVNVTWTALGNGGSAASSSYAFVVVNRTFTPADYARYTFPFVTGPGDTSVAVGLEVQGGPVIEQGTGRSCEQQTQILVDDFELVDEGPA